MGRREGGGNERDGLVVKDEVIRDASGGHVGIQAGADVAVAAAISGPGVLWHRVGSNLTEDEAAI